MEWVQYHRETVRQEGLSEPLIGIPERQDPLAQGPRGISVIGIIDIESSPRVAACCPICHRTLIAIGEGCDSRAGGNWYKGTITLEDRAVRADEHEH